MKLFREFYIKDHFRKKTESITKFINSIAEAELEGVDNEKILENVYKRYKFDNFDIDFENKRPAKIVMEKIKGENFPMQYDTEKGKYYDCAKVRYTFVTKGDHSFLGAQPTISYFSDNINVAQNGNEFNIDFQTYHGNDKLPEKLITQIKGDISRIVDALKNQVGKINEEINDFNSSIKEFSTKLISDRKKSLSAKKNIEDDLSNY